VKAWSVGLSAQAAGDAPGGSRRQAMGWRPPLRIQEVALEVRGQHPRTGRVRAGAGATDGTSIRASAAGSQATLVGRRPSRRSA